MKKKNLLFVLFTLIVSLSEGQVREIKSNIQTDKNEVSTLPIHSSASSNAIYYSAPSFGDGIAEFLVGSFFYYTFYGAYLGAHQAQGYMQDRREFHPETFSLQGSILGGFDFPQNATTLASSLRGNWGIFASDIRYLHTNDVTGKLNVWDWQILLLRFPIRNIKMEYGVGFSHIFNPSKTYFEQSTGVDYCFLSRKATLQAGYRWTAKTNIGERFREELSLQVDYEIAHSSLFRFSPSIGFVRQNHFASTHFNLFTVGLKIRRF